MQLPTHAFLRALACPAVNCKAHAPMNVSPTDAQGLAGRVNLERLLQRRPLLPPERQAQPATVCVTGQYRRAHAKVGAVPPPLPPPPPLPRLLASLHRSTLFPAPPTPRRRRRLHRLPRCRAPAGGGAHGACHAPRRRR